MFLVFLLLQNRLNRITFAVLGAQFNGNISDMVLWSISSFYRQRFFGGKKIQFLWNLIHFHSIGLDAKMLDVPKAIYMDKYLNPFTFTQIMFHRPQQIMQYISKAYVWHNLSRMEFAYLMDRPERIRSKTHTTLDRDVLRFSKRSQTWVCEKSGWLLCVQRHAAYNSDNSQTIGIEAECVVSGVRNVGVRWFLIMMVAWQRKKWNEWGSEKLNNLTEEEKHFALKFPLPLKHRLQKLTVCIVVNTCSRWVGWVVPPPPLLCALWVRERKF